MAQPPRTATAGTFFVTAVTSEGRHRFTVEANARHVLDTLQHYRREGFYKLHAFVLMPDHAHILLTTADLPAAMKRIKGTSSHRIASPIPVWQRGYTDHLIQSRADFLTHRDYIHQNPVRARLCHRPEDFPYSSAYRPSS